MHKTKHDSETPAHGQQVISVGVVIWHDFDGIKKAFVPKRAETKKFLPSLFEAPGGHIDFGETLVDGLKREMREEFDMDISVGEPFNAFTYLNEVKGSHTVQIDYLATFVGPLENIKLDPEDHSEFRWMTEEEIAALKDITSESKHTLTKGLHIIKNQRTV